jgi:hypothetical protein
MAHTQATSAPDSFAALRGWIDRFEPQRPEMARLLVRLIPGRCPFERNVTVLGHQLLHIPPLCKINPLYEEVAALRFRCLLFLESYGQRRSAA